MIKKTCARSFIYLVITVIFLLTTGNCQSEAERTIPAIAAASNGSAVVFLMKDHSKDCVIAVQPGSARVLWRNALKNTPTVATVSPDNQIVAIGFTFVGGDDPGVILLDMLTGKQVGALGIDGKSLFSPGAVYPRYGSGVSQLAFSPDGALLYGLSNDTLFAWDVAAKKYLWIKDVPATIEAPPDLPDPLPYGHAFGFALSPDGRQIAAQRNALWIAAAGVKPPGHFIRRYPQQNFQIDVATFSSDNKILAAGDFSVDKSGRAVSFATDLWIDGSTKSVNIPGCGNGIAWTGAPDVFACQNASGAHLRNIDDPQKDIGQAGPVSDLPLLKVGNSIWAAAYKTDDWKNPTQSLPLTLVELGTGKRVTVTLPGR